MRKLILISAFVLASASVHAGESRGLALAANDQPEVAATVQPAPATAQPATVKADVKADTVQPEASKPEAPKPEAAKPEASKQQASRPKKIHARRYEGDEAKARRIAARYGVYW
jgi:hypothetical protein